MDPTPNPAATAPNIVDLHQIIEDFTWNQFLDLQSASKKNEYKGLERDDVTFEANLRKLNVIHTEPNYQNFHPTSAKPYTLFKTVFNNNTARNQEYSFKTERATESVVTVMREQGYMFGAEMELALKTPCEVVEAKAGFKHELHFNKGQENSISETLTWGVDSCIVVPAKCQTTAELVVEEMSYNGRFNVDTHLSGRVTVSIIRRRDSALILPMSTNIVEIFKEAMSGNTKAARELKPMCSIEQNRVVRLNTKGSCNFQFAMKQRVALTEELGCENKSTQTTDSSDFHNSSYQTTPVPHTMDHTTYNRSPIGTYGNSEFHYMRYGRR